MSGADDPDVFLFGDPDEFVRLAAGLCLVSNFVLDRELLGDRRFRSVLRAADAVATSLGALVRSAGVDVP